MSINRQSIRLITLQFLITFIVAEEYSTGIWSNKQSFAIDLIRSMQFEYGNETFENEPFEDKDKIGNGIYDSDKNNRQIMINQNGGLKVLTNESNGILSIRRNYRRFLEWLRSFSFSTNIDFSNRFLVRRLVSINCPALFSPDDASQLIPKFFSFSETKPEEPIELNTETRSNECPHILDRSRRTILLIHGFASDIRTIGGMINIKDRLLDLNKQINERSSSKHQSGQLYNIIFVDWYNGANPYPRFNYIKAAVNTQVVGKLIARFLLNLQRECNILTSEVDIIAHSLGCHVAGFTGKALRSMNSTLGTIIHLDPVGLCFGTMFGRPEHRLSKDDALDTKAIHVAMNMFDNPIDGARSNFLVNGGRDQIGCGSQSEMINATISSTTMVYDSNGSFKPCSHLRAMSLFEDDLSSNSVGCQIVAYECEDFQSFLSGKCGYCDERNSQCKLMSFNPIDGSKRNGSTGTDERAMVRANVNDPNLDEDDDEYGSSEKLNTNDGRSYYVGTSSISTYCVNYYQFRMLVRERTLKQMSNDNLAPNRYVRGRLPNGKNSLHFTIKLIDDQGRFFKGFTIDHDVRRLRDLKSKYASDYGLDRQIEFTMLLNTTEPRPVKVTESIISFYYHQMIIADTVEINFMSNISPRYSII